jgi:hypothetical protein
MPVESRHPEYQSQIRDWQACRDVYEGQSAVKARDNGMRYLPPTTGMWLDGMQAYSYSTYGAQAYVAPNKSQMGYINYLAYRDRALLSGFFSDAIDMFMGMLWHRPPTIELGPLKPYFGDEKPATADGQTLLQLLRRIHAEQLTIGRCGILGDLPEIESTRPTPYIELYQSERIINWDDGGRELATRRLNLVVIDECGKKRKPNLEWEDKESWRILNLGALETNEETGAYRVAVVDKPGALDPAAFTVAPNVRNRGPDEMPFVFIGAKSTTTRIDRPPFLTLVEQVLALYRMDADYRQCLHMQGQETLFTKCAEDGEVSSVGAGAHINIKNPKGDAKFIGLSGNGLGEMRQAHENETARCAKKAGELLADSSKQRESADALVERTGSKGTKLIDIALTAAEGLQRMLRILARWLGLPDTEIVVKPNKEWSAGQFASKTLLELVQAYVLNAPITLQSIHEYNVRNGYTTLTWDEMIAAKRSEVELLGELMPMAPPKPGDDANDNSDGGKAA